ncbi:dihydropyrimidinase [Heliobacillus mobilis]|uniref:Dihydropyrimidinase n=1 Tax=Heliobacterium mobile TaxID=28064 RepID=A0A6I3SJU7_HELMO|nr:dihydropyrimidinase [Heliobacterium mobile]MTV49181.1 dihydropyrimidinase [Heliobacterium mobile]
MGLVLRGGTVVTALETYPADVRIDGEQIGMIAQHIEPTAADQVLDVTGKYLLPGGIDAHTHFDLPFGDMSTADDFESGSRSAVMGGTTTVIDFATQFRGEPLTEALENWHDKARGKSYCDYGFHMAISDWKQGMTAQMEELVRKSGVTSFKLYMAYKGSMQVDDGVLFDVLRKSGEMGALVCLHCENGDVVNLLVQEARAQGRTAPSTHPLTRPPAVEEEAVARAIALANMAKAPLYIVHLSTRGALETAERARKQGACVYIETCPQYLLLDDRRYEGESFESAKYVISPPLRSPEHGEALWEGIRRGAVDTIATDHCSFNFQGQKSLGRNDFSKIPNGMPGVEHRLGLLYSAGVVPGKISLNQFVSLTATRPAQLFGIFPRKGTIAVGSDADIVLWDPQATKVIGKENHHCHVDYEPYEGFSQTGLPVHVFLRGRQIVRDGKLLDSAPGGRYLFRKPLK